MEAVEILLQTLFGGLPGVDGAAKLLLVLTHERPPRLELALLAATVVLDGLARCCASCERRPVGRLLPCSSVQRTPSRSSSCRLSLWQLPSVSCDAVPSTRNRSPAQARCGSHRAKSVLTWCPA